MSKIEYSEDQNQDGNPLAKRFKFSSGDYQLIQLFVDEICKMRFVNEGKRLQVEVTMEDQVSVVYLKNFLPFLLKCSDDINYIDEHGQTILHVYLANNESCYIKECREESNLAKSMVFKIVRCLLERGASVNAVDKCGRTPLHIAAMIKSKLELIQPMLQFFNNIDTCDNEGNTVLHALVCFNPSRTINGLFLIQFVCHIFQDSDRERAFFDIVRALLSRGADPNKRNKSGMTPLQYAVKHFQVSLLRIFKEYNADFNVYTDNGDNLLNIVVQEFDSTVSVSILIEIIDYLVEQGCDLNSKNKEGFSILHFAVKRYLAAETIERLLKLGADVNGQTNEKQTPLHLAFINFKSTTADRLKIVIRALTYAGANWYAMDCQGRTPLFYALRPQYYHAIWSYVLSYYVDVMDQEVWKILKACPIQLQRTILLRAVELKTAGFPIDKRYELKMDKLKYSRKHREKCLKEVDAMKTHMIGDGVSIYKFLHMNWRRQFNLANFLPPNLEKMFPIYEATIRNICDQADRRNQLLEPAKEACCKIAKINLPDICLERICQFLNNGSLKVFIDAMETIMPDDREA